MLKLVDKPDLGSGAVRRVGSSPTIRTAMPMLPLRSMGVVYNSMATKRKGTELE